MFRRPFRAKIVTCTISRFVFVFETWKGQCASTNSQMHSSCFAFNVNHLFHYSFSFIFIYVCFDLFTQIVQNDHVYTPMVYIIIFAVTLPPNMLAKFVS